MAISVPLRCKLCHEVFRISVHDEIADVILPRICPKCLGEENKNKKGVKNDIRHRNTSDVPDEEWESE